MLIQRNIYTFGKDRGVGNGSACENVGVAQSGNGFNATGAMLGKTAVLQSRRILDMRDRGVSCWRLDVGLIGKIAMRAADRGIALLSTGGVDLGGG